MLIKYLIGLNVADSDFNCGESAYDSEKNGPLKIIVHNT